MAASRSSNSFIARLDRLSGFIADRGDSTRRRNGQHIKAVSA
jgi:hypothetical protein